MAVVKFNRPDGSDIWINPDYVVYVTPRTETAGSALTMANDKTLFVTDPLNVTFDKLNRPS